MTGNLTLLFLTLASAGYLAVDLRAAWYYYHAVENDEIADPFVQWWVRQNIGMLGMIGGIFLLATLITCSPEFTLYLRSIRIEINHPIFIAFSLILPGYVAYELIMVWKYSHEPEEEPETGESTESGVSEESGEPEESFTRWWVLLLLRRIGEVIFFLGIALFVTFPPEGRLHLPSFTVPVTYPELLLMVLVAVVLAAYGLKVAREYFQGTPELSEGNASFFRWWLRDNAVELRVMAGIALGVTLIISFPESFSYLGHYFKIIRQLKLAVMGLILTLVVIAFLAIDLKIAQRYHRNNLVLLIAGIPFLRWWTRVNVIKFTVLGSATLLILSGVFLTARFHFLSAKAESSGYIANAARYFKQEKYKEASLELRNAIQRNPEDAEAHLALAQAYWRLGAVKDAVLTYQRAAELDPYLTAAHLELGQLAFSLGDMELALQEANKAQELSPEKPEPSLLLARIYLSQGKRDLAVKQCRTILVNNPADRDARNQLIIIYLEKRAFAEAVREAEAGLKLFPGDIGLQIMMANAIEGTGNATYAAAILQAAAARDLASPAPFLALGDMQVRRGEFLQAIESYEEALQRAPDNDVVLNNIAMITADHGYDLDRAVELAARLYALHPNEPAILDTMGWVLYRQGKLSQALPLLRMAVDKMPDNPIHRYHLGAALLKAGKRTTGRFELENALRLSNNFDGSAQARTLLNSSAGK